MDGVDHLIGLLKLVKKSGWNHAFRDDVLYGRVDAESSDSHSYIEPLLTLRRALNDSKICMETLNKVRDHLGKKIRSLKRASTPLVLEDGIRRLPDELLARIFELGHLSDQTSWLSLPVSHVSSRFRQIALRTPILWTRLSARSTSGLLRMFISRSGSLNLDVAFEHIPGSGQEFLTIVGALSHRWASLSVTNVGLAYLSVAGLATFPTLKSLSYNGNSELDGWSMPSLSHFAGYRRITPNNRVLAQLTCIELQCCDQRVDVPSLARSLYQARNLQDLTLTLLDCEEGHGSPPLDAAEIPAPLSFNLKSLKISICGDPGDMSYSILQPLHSAISYLLPLTTDIFLAHYPSYNLYGEGGELFPGGKSIRLHIAGSCDISSILETLLLPCRIAHSVCLEAPEGYSGGFPLDFGEVTCHTSLRHLCFRNCDILDDQDAKRLANIFLAHRAITDLQSLEFERCKEISEECLLNLQDEYRDKLKWSI